MGIDDDSHRWTLPPEGFCSDLEERAERERRSSVTGSDDRDEMTRPEFTRAAVLRGGSIVAAGGIASTALAAVLTTILGIELGDEGFGSYAFVIATAGVLAAVARMGLGPIIVRDIARSVDEDSATRGTRQPILTALVITAALSAVIAIVTISPIGRWILESSGDLSFSMVGALAVLMAAQALYTNNAESLRGLHHLGSAALLGLPVQRLVSLALVAGVVYMASSDLDPPLAIWLIAAAAVTAVVASGLGLWSRIRSLPGANPNAALARKMTRDGSPILLTNVLGLAGARLPVWVLAILGTLGQAGVFALATAYVTLIRFGHKTMVGTLSPFIATSYHSGDREALQRRVRVTAAATSLAAVAAAIAMVVAGTVIVPRFFPSGFADAVGVAAILLIGTIATALTGPCGLLLNLTGNEKWAARASLISVGLAAIAIFPAGSAGGALGAAAVMAIATVLRVALLLRFAYQQTGIMTAADFPALYRSLRRSPA